MARISLIDISDTTLGSKVVITGSLSEQMAQLLQNEYSKPLVFEETDELSASQEGFQSFHSDAFKKTLEYITADPDSDVGVLYAVNPSEISHKDIIELAAIKNALNDRQTFNTSVVYLGSDIVESPLKEGFEAFAALHGIVVCTSASDYYRKFLKC
jgi:hypothetical protein